jgi:hypothetical protein
MAMPPIDLALKILVFDTELLCLEDLPFGKGWLVVSAKATLDDPVAFVYF